MAESKISSIVLLTIGSVLICAWCIFWRYINLAVQQALQDWLCNSPGCFKLFEILRFMVIWGYNFLFVFLAIGFISGLFGILSGNTPEWLKREESKKKEKRF